MTAIKMKLSCYDYRVLDKAVKNLIETAKYENVQTKGPIPLPTEKEIVTVLTSPHKHKDAREQFERRTHVRLIQFSNPSDSFKKRLNTIAISPTIKVAMKLV